MKRKILWALSFIMVTFISLGGQVTAEEVTKNEDALEQYILQEIQKETGNKRSGITEDIANNIMTNIGFEVGFVKDSGMINLIYSLGYMDKDYHTEIDWYNSLPNKKELSMDVFDAPTNQTITLKSKYIDNQSDTTLLLQHGWRGKGNDMLYLAQQLMAAGYNYNFIIPDARSHGDSQGTYITFGAYEKEDLNKWLDTELANKPAQQLFVVGTSMGAGITMLSQETPHANVLAFIEDCGYESAEAQFGDILERIFDMVKTMPVVGQIPAFTDFDHEAKKSQLLSIMNERKVKPIIKKDLFDISPLNAVQKNELPKLFIHGESDGFINISHMNDLYANAAGYKEKATFPGADHAMSVFTDTPRYIKLVTDFINKIKANEQIATLPAKTVEPKNLLQNANFTTSTTGFNSWQVAEENSSLFTDKELIKNNVGEFVLENKGGTDYATAMAFEQGIRFFNRNGGSSVKLGQAIPLVKGENYQLSFESTNLSAATSTYPKITYQLGTVTKTDQLKDKKTTKKQLIFSPTTSADYYASISSAVGYYSWLDKSYVHTGFKQLSLINTDVTAPNQVDVISSTIEQNNWNITGTGEANTSILLLNDDGTQLKEVKTDDLGNFAISIETSSVEHHLHIVNQDINGNSSESFVLRK